MKSIVSTWSETGILCTHCGHMTYSNGFFRPTCSNEECLETVSNQEIWHHLVALSDDESNARRWRYLASLIDIPVSSTQYDVLDKVLSLYCYEERDRK